jgi:hypothetical protein
MLALSSLSSVELWSLRSLLSLCNREHLQGCLSSTVEWYDDVRISRRPCGRAANHMACGWDVWPRKNMTNRAPMRAAEQARRIVDLWQERPRWQRTAEHVLPFYGWLSQYEPAVIPSGPGSILKVCTILAAHLLYRGESASTPAAFDNPSAAAASSRDAQSRRTTVRREL